MADRVAVPRGEMNAGEMNALEGFSTATHHAPDMSILGMFLQADLVVKSVILLLVAASFWSWKIIFEKFVRYRYVHQRMRIFEEAIWSGDSLEAHYEQQKKGADNPMAKLFVAGMYELFSSRKSSRTKAKADEQLALDMDDGNHKLLSLQMGIKDRVLQVMDSTRNREISRLEKDLSFLATVGSAAPFIGLFGTVWGIMNSFQAIATMNNTTLTVVAPGIAEALFATAIGLFAAIPAVIFYNKYANQVSDFSDRLDVFSDEFSSVISRELEE